MAIVSKEYVGFSKGDIKKLSNIGKEKLIEMIQEMEDEIIEREDRISQMYNLQFIEKSNEYNRGRVDGMQYVLNIISTLFSDECDDE